jgi:hypothetical protein
VSFRTVFDSLGRLTNPFSAEAHYGNWRLVSDKIPMKMDLADELLDILSYVFARLESSAANLF